MRRAATILSAIVLTLVLLGLVMLYSTGSARAATPHYYLQRQIAWLTLSLAVGAVVMRMDYRRWRMLAIPLMLVTVVLLLLVFVPGIGGRVKGSYRWLRVGGMGFQPSELAKLSVIVGLSSYMARFGRHGQLLTRGLLIPMTGLGLVAALIMAEPDFGTTFAVMTVGLALLFAGGTRVVYLVATGLLGLLGFGVAVLLNPVRLGRVMSFLWPERYPDQAYHLTQSLYAFYLGGAFGVGLGNSMQKHFYLPESHTDFILAIMAEELGFSATLLVLVLFAGYFLCGMTISRHAPDPFGRLLGFGVTMMITLQAAINMMVVTGLGPTKGLPLPFVSYGGSSLLMSVVMTAVLLSLARTADVHATPTRRAIRDRVHHL